MCSDCAHLRTTSRTCSLIDSFPVIVTPSISSAVTRSMPGKHGGRLKARLLRRLSVRSSSVNNAAACNPPPRRFAVNVITWRPRPKPNPKTGFDLSQNRNRFYKRNPVLETLQVRPDSNGLYSKTCARQLVVFIKLVATVTNGASRRRQFNAVLYCAIGLSKTAAEEATNELDHELK